MISSIDVPPIKNFVSTKRHSDITTADLSHQWRIGIKQAQDTLDTTTQRFSRSDLLPISRRYRNDRMFYRKYLNHQFSADLYMARTKSLHGNTCAYTFSHKSGFAQAYHQANKTKSSDSLRQFAIDWGISRKLVEDGTLEQIGQNTEFIKRCRTYDINLQKTLQRVSFEKCARSGLESCKQLTCQNIFGTTGLSGYVINATDNFFILPLQWQNTY
jgi:hypothetical protein